jgi:hypothetical protein
MADTKISALPSGAPAQAGDEYVIARGGANYKLTLTNIAASMPPIGATTPNTGAFTTLSASGAASFTTLSASGAASFADGTSSAPAITNTGDTNTGVYFPAADEVAVAAGGSVAAAFNSNGVFFRNRIINGDMRIDQRNAGAAVTTSGAFPVDRFAITNTSDGAFSAQQDSSVPTGSGFVNSVKVTATTADATLTAAQTLNFSQGVEGTNVADLMWGTASARPVTLSFWVRSSLTGTFGGSLRNNGGARSYPFSYSISVADTWEYKTVTIPGDTSGTWLTTTGLGVQVVFGLGAGPDRSGTAGAWVSANVVAPTGAVSVIGTLNATWYVTGVQLETGSVATPFERRPFGTELMLCQRYYYRMKATGVNAFFGTGLVDTTTNALFITTFPVSMRTAPSALDQTGTATDYRVTTGGANIVCSSVPVFASGEVFSVRTQFVVASGLTVGQAMIGRSETSNAYLGWSAEL